eukprot:TRINITY_DN36193_c0_g1_i1.p2 TRINITY_DN36193_c0_g1~~TRINITY_DN36193_c0_g1_i1.p2  ORF type:complete len:236 (+),score=94.93 TRINITY_DN36193_c0_g1_i1:72-710(+)
MPSLKVEIVSDVVCPWCWVGQRKLRKALSAYGDKLDVSITWHPFLLRPDTPMEGFQKSPDTPSNPRVGARLRQAGAAVGIDFTGKSDIRPNTVIAHAGLKKAAELEASGAAPKGSQDRLSEEVFHAYFTAGTPLDAAGVADAAARAGITDRQAILAACQDRRLMGVVHEEAAKYSRQGISGVPSFFFNGRYAFSGAQDPEEFRRVIDSVLAS